MFAFIPHQIEESWGKWGPTLAGFPVTILYARPIDHQNGKVRVLKAEYIFDPGTFTEDDEQKQMEYNRRDNGPYRVVVIYKKRTGVWRTEKYRGEQLIQSAQGHDFQSAMLHTTMDGPEEGEGIEGVVDI